MSAQKQCPKCGEKNPAEAVMCWACYTSLSGGVAGAVGGTVGAPTAAMTDSGEKKKIEPKQLAIIGLGLVVVLGLGVKTMMGSGEEPVDDLTFPTQGGNSGGMEPSPPKPAEPSGSVGTAPPPPSGQGPEAPKSGPAGAPPFPYTLMAAPNPREKWATMAIVPNQGEMKESEARQLADFAYRYQQRTKKFAAVEIFVINNRQSAQVFAEYQSSHRGARLTQAAYQALQDVWRSTPVRYLNINGKPSYSSPQKNPSGFWNPNNS